MRGVAHPSALARAEVVNAAVCLGVSVGSYWPVAALKSSKAAMRRMKNATVPKRLTMLRPYARSWNPAARNMAAAQAIQEVEPASAPMSIDVLMRAL